MTIRVVSDHNSISGLVDCILWQFNYQWSWIHHGVTRNAEILVPSLVAPYCLYQLNLDEIFRGQFMQWPYLTRWQQQIYSTRILLDLIMIRIHADTDSRCTENGPRLRFWRVLYIYIYISIYIYIYYKFVLSVCWCLTN